MEEDEELKYVGNVTANKLTQTKVTPFSINHSVFKGSHTIFASTFRLCMKIN